MKIASVAEVKSKFSSFLRESKGGPVIVTRNGKPVGVLLSMEDEEEIERLLACRGIPPGGTRRCLAAARHQNSDRGRYRHTENSGREWKRKGYPIRKNSELPE